MKILIKIIIFLCIALTVNLQNTSAGEKIKIGLLVPITGQDSIIGKSIIKSIRLANNKINSPNIEIIPRDTASDPYKTLRSAQELYKEGIRIIIGPVFNENLIYLEELDDIIFLSLTNKIIDNPKNIISAGINANSQLNTIKKFQEINKMKNTIYLIPQESYKEEIEKVIKTSGIKTDNIYYYETNPTKLTKQIEKITKYTQRKQRLKDEIKRLEISEEINKEKKIENLEKKDTLGKVNFDSLIISDFDEGLKSVITSLLYTDISPKNIYFITLNQWFDESLLKEKNLQPIYFPSINKKNFNNFIKEYYEIFNEYPNELSFLSYDLFGLVYFLIVQNDFKVDKKMFLKKNMFKGKVGIFEIKDNKINHILNFYKVENNKFKRIF